MIDRAVGRVLAPGRGPGTRSGLGSRRAVRIAFAVSVGVHVLAVLAYPIFVPTLRPEGHGLRFGTPARAHHGLEVLNLVAVDAVPEVQRPDDPREVVEVAAATQVQGPRLEEAIVFELPHPGLTPAERLRPNPMDRRLWAPLPPEFSELTLEQREELAIAGRLGAWYDSVSAAAAAQAAWTDWTYTDGDGGRWGISPGLLHLGHVAIPLPAFQAPPGQREYMWQWNEIARQGAQAAVQETVRERMEAIRARRDRERALARQADSAQAAPP
jgi:hypothetical protein